MAETDKDIMLGKEIAYPEKYDASLLSAIPRAASRDRFGAGSTSEFVGVDLWTAYELSWLNAKGLPQVAIAEFEFPASSPNIVESKSFKYYLNSFNQAVQASPETLIQKLKKDLSGCCGGEVEVRLFSLDEYNDVARIQGTCVDKLDVSTEHYTPAPEVLTCTDKRVDKVQLYSHLLKSNCPVTGQPDWATVWIEYSGQEISPESFLRYIVSYRGHQGFHESCVEGIYYDLLQRCKPSSLSVYARYTRRGGLDINPFRTSVDTQENGYSLPFKRLSRQ